MTQFNNNYQNNNQQQGGQRHSYSHVNMQVIANIVTDPESKAIGQNGAKVGQARIAINHSQNQNQEADFWNIEIWVNQGNSSGYHDFLVEHCKKGRKIFIEGTPQLKRTKRQSNGQDVLDPNGKAIYDYYPTIRVSKIMGLGSNESNNNNNQQQGGFNNQQQQPQGQPAGGFNQQQPQQGGFAPQQPQGQPGGFGAPQGQPGGFAPQPPNGQFQPR